MESKQIPIKSNTLELPTTEEVKLEEGETVQTGNPQKKKPKLRRSTAVNFEDDQDALKTLKKSQFQQDDDGEQSVSDDDSEEAKQ